MKRTCLLLLVAGCITNDMINGSNRHYQTQPTSQPAAPLPTPTRLFLGSTHEQGFASQHLSTIVRTLQSTMFKRRKDQSRIFDSTTLQLLHRTCMLLRNFPHQDALALRILQTHTEQFNALLMAINATEKSYIGHDFHYKDLLAEENILTTMLIESLQALYAEQLEIHGMLIGEEIILDPMTPTDQMQKKVTTPPAGPRKKCRHER